MTGLGEGGTPLMEMPGLAESLGIARLYAKVEASNPTGSYKDRVAARSMDVAVERGCPGWIATSSGNAGTSFAAYGRRAGLPGVLCVQESITREKLLPALALGARVVRVGGVGDRASHRTEERLFDVVRRIGEVHGLFVGITAHSFNHEGMRAAETISHEIVADGVDPEAAYVPVGGGGLVAAIVRGFQEAGASARVVAAQPSGCAPISRCLEGDLSVPIVDENESTISGLQLPSPPDGRLAVDRVREVDGWGVTATDDDIHAAQRELSLTEGVFVEPAAACALAGLRKDVQSGRIGSSTSVVLVLTGSGFKDLASLERSLEPPPLASVDDLPDLLSGWLQ